MIACVDSHRLVRGPLHGQTIVAIKTDSKPEWVKFDLERYRTHRLHLEFVPAENQQLSVRFIAQGLEAEALDRLSQKLKLFDQRFIDFAEQAKTLLENCLLYTSPSPRDATLSRMPSSA